MPSFLIVVLWTDILIYTLLAIVIAGVFYIRQHPHLKAPWKFVFKRKRGVISVMVLLCYVFIGLLDSVHFRQALVADETAKTQHYSTEILTILDLAILPLRQNVEKTYSAAIFNTAIYARNGVFGRG